MNNMRYLPVLMVSIIIGSCAISKKENERFETSNAENFRGGLILTGDSISDDHLKYFENRAIQKLVDFYEYLGMLGHDSYTESIKKEVRSSALRLFHDDETEINPYLDNLQSETKGHLNVIIAEDFDSQIYPVLEILYAEVEEGLTMKPGGYYQGKMGFDIKNSTETTIITKEAIFSLRRINKTFGTKTIRVWEVFLDKIH